jgi:hypothetical protein
MGDSRREQYRKRRSLGPLLRGWYGDERAAVEMTAYTGQPVNAGDIMRELCGKLIDEDVALFITLETKWKEIIPGKLAACASPARFADGVLYLEVRHSALVRELTPSLDLFLARIAKAVGEGKVREIRLVPSGSLRRRN